MKILVCGGRDYADIEKVYETLSGLHTGPTDDCVSVVIQGGAHGADALARSWARDNAVHHAEVVALWGEFGKAAGPMRNCAMLLLDPDLVVAFPGGRGTADMVRKAKAAGIEVLEVT